MTAQIGDELVLDGTRLTIHGALPIIRLAAIVDTPGRARMNTACWRGYVAAWRISDGELWLDAIDGAWALEGDPVPARWVTTHVRASAGPPVWYVHMGFASEFAGVVELDIREGRVVRRRQFTTPASGYNAPWLTDPSTALRFACPSDVALDPPPRSPAIGTRLREACRLARRDQGLRAGEVAARLGFSPKRAGRIGEWEVGTRALDRATVVAVADLLGIDAATRARLDEEDGAESQVARDVFLDEPIVPTLRFVGDFAYQCSLPTGWDPSREGAIRWAKACVDASWRAATLYVTRRDRVAFDQDGGMRTLGVSVDEGVPHGTHAAPTGSTA